MEQNLINSTSNIESNSCAPISADARSTSVAELRRKAQEHSAALLHSLHAVAGLSFPLHFPPISFQALSNRSVKNGHFVTDYQNDLSINNNNNNNIVGKVEPVDKNDLVTLNNK